MSAGCALYAPGQDLCEHVLAGQSYTGKRTPEPRAQVRILPGALNLLPGALNRTCSRTNADRALRTDLHLYSEAVGFVRHSPARVPMSWAPMQLIARPHGKLRPAGPFLRQHPSRTLGIKHPSSGRFNRPRTLSTGGMSYSKLPSGACRLIRSLRVSRLADVQDTESNISPTLHVQRLDPRPGGVRR